MQWTGKIYQTFNTLNISALNMHGGGVFDRCIDNQRLNQASLKIIACLAVRNLKSGILNATFYYRYFRLYLV